MCLLCKTKTLYITQTLLWLSSSNWSLEDLPCGSKCIPESAHQHPLQRRSPHCLIFPLCTLQPSTSLQWKEHRQEPDYKAMAHKIVKSQYELLYFNNESALIQTHHNARAWVIIIVHIESLWKMATIIKDDWAVLMIISESEQFALKLVTKGFTLPSVMSWRNIKY